jgi:hypothetical protein
MTLCRVYTNQETTEGYQKIFVRAFNLVATHTQKSVQFHYLHDSGIKSIGCDMCPKQMKGKYDLFY